MNIKYKFASLLTEGYNFTNVDEVMSAIKTNQIGVKIDPSYKELNGNTSSHVRLNLLKFFNKCERLGIKDTTYGIQLLLSKTNDMTLNRAVINDGLYEFLKSYKKPWVKQLPEYKEIMNKPYDDTLWHDLEKAIQEEQSKHGKSSKGSGQLKDVKTLYDDGTWKMLVPSSFEGEKAAAYYIKDGKETPTNWCTRVSDYHYNHYTEEGPLYIIRNMKTGKSYQLAFTENRVAFLDQNDEKGDEVTNGDLSKIPDELLKLIKHPENGKTLLDYKKRSMDDSIPSKKGRLPTNKEFVGPDQLSRPDKNTSFIKFGPEINIGLEIIKKHPNISDATDSIKDLIKYVCKKEILNFSDEADKMSNYDSDAKVNLFFNNSSYIKKGKATAYYFKTKPNALYFLFRKNSRIIERGKSKKFYDIEPLEQAVIETAAAIDFGIGKHNSRELQKLESFPDAGDLGQKILEKSLSQCLNKVNNSNIFENSNFKKVVHFSLFCGEIRSIVNETLISRLTLETKKGHEIILIFFDSSKRKEVPFNKANCVKILTDSERQDSGKLFLEAKKIALSLMKEVIKLPEYKKFHDNYQVRDENTPFASMKTN